MKKIILLAFFALSYVAQAQDLPKDPEPGKCYVRCTTPDVYENKEEQIVLKPSHKVLKVVPAEYEVVTEKVLIKEASKKLVVVPATWKKVPVSYVKKQASHQLTVSPATLNNETKIVEVKPAFTRWEMSSEKPDCDSSNPDDCKYWCYKKYPAEYKTIPTKILGQDASYSSKDFPKQEGEYMKTIIDNPAHVKEVEIPAKYSTIKKTMLVKDAYTTEVVVPAVQKTVKKEVLVKKGGLTTWKEVECALVEYQVLPINWNLASATLTSKAKGLIDSRLLPVLHNNPGVKLEIASHTDSRGTKASNQDLSERRARAVVNYLKTKGINESLLVANGYGETRLKNRCSDGVSCTEREHAVNRRTEFRLIQ